MLTSYKRRAFVLLAVVALEPALASSARASESDSLWDILNRTSVEAVGYNMPPTGTFTAHGTLRQPLGPIPGFTIPAPDDAAANAEAAKKTRRGMFGAFGEWFNNLEKSTGTKITATGSSTLSMRADSVSGQASSFQSEQDFGRGSNGFYNQTDLTVDATVFKYFHYTTRVSNSLFHNPNDNTVKLDYKDKHTEVEWGDLNAQFQGNSLIDFSRYLHGVKLTRDWSSSFKTTLLYSQTKAEPRTIVVPGNDSAGPYFVYSGQIVEGSEHVRVDNSAELRKGEDYQLDPFTGELKFLNNRIIPHTSTIAISYESLGTGQGQGTVYGGRVEYKLNHSLNFGMTYVGQQSRGTTGFQLQTEEQHGLGAPQFYTTNSPIDLTKTLFVFVEGRQLGLGEYVVDNSTLYTNRIFIKLTIPFESIVRLQYIPYNSNPTPGSRNIVGLDSTLRLGKLGSLTLETALSGLSLVDSNVSGHAWQVRADLNPFAKVHTTVALRDISPTFSSVQSPGFNRNEKALEIATDYSPTDRLHLNMNYTDSRRPSYASGSQFTVATNGTDQYSQYGVGVNYGFAKNASLTLQRNSLSSKFALGGQSVNDNNTLGLNYNLERARLTFEASLSQNQSNVSSSYALLGLTPTSGNASQLFGTTSSTFSKRLGVGWQPKSWLHLHGTISDNDITSGGTTSNTHSNARDTSLDAQFSLIRGLHINYNFTLSDTGNGAASQLLTSLTGTPTGATGNTTALGNGANVRAVLLPLWVARMQSRDIVAGGSTSGLSGTTNFNNSGSIGSLLGGGVNSNLGGLGNYSGGLGGGALSNYGLTSYGGKSYQHTLGIDYQPWSNFHIGTQFLKGSSVGDYQFNSSRDDMAFNIYWQLRRVQLTASYGLQNLTYTGGQGSSASTTMVLGIQGRPFGGKLDVQLNWSLLRTKSAFNFASVTPAGLTSGLSTPTTGLTDTSTNLSNLGFEVDYPLSSRQTVFVRSLLGTTTGYLGNTESNLSFGLRYGITRTMAFELGWQLQDHKYADPTNASLNYKASSLLANLGFHF